MEPRPGEPVKPGAFLLLLDHVKSVAGLTSKERDLLKFLEVKAKAGLGLTVTLEAWMERRPTSSPTSYRQEVRKFNGKMRRYFEKYETTVEKLLAIADVEPGWAWMGLEQPTTSSEDRTLVWTENQRVESPYRHPRHTFDSLSHPEQVQETSATAYLPAGNYTVRQLEHESEIEQVFQLNYAAFKDDALPLEKMKEFWHAYRPFVIALFQGGRLAGALTVLPLEIFTYEKLRAGTMSERDINPDELRAFMTKPSFRRYVVGGLVMQDIARTTAYSALLEGALKTWLTPEETSFPLRVMAPSNTEEGANRLRALRFTPTGTTSPEGWNIFEALYASRGDAYIARAEGAPKL